jgi:hypothetical protein
MRAILRKKGQALIPVDERGHSLLAKIKEGKEVKVEVRQSRNLRHLRLYWAMVDFLREHVDEFASATDEAIHVALKQELGLGRYVQVSPGLLLFLEDHSISFEAMPDQQEFNAYFDRAVHVITDKWLAGSKYEEVRNEINAMADPIKGRAA